MHYFLCAVYVPAQRLCQLRALTITGKNAFPWQPVVCVVPFSITVAVKKEGWGGGGTRTLTFSAGDSDFPALKPAGKTLNVSIARGLPKDTSKSARQIAFIHTRLCFSSTARKPFNVHNIAGGEIVARTQEQYSKRNCHMNPALRYTSIDV